ncbi:MAG: histone deacetylase [Verrucomicrobiales bacterium]|nr:histone deacetylase [Verrucomicrobiales bacterium]
MIVITDQRCTRYATPGHPERPARISRTLTALESQQRIAVEFDRPADVAETQLLRVHSPDHLERLRVAADFDADTPAHPGIREHAERSVGSALRALDLALAGRRVFSLIRPPGHHATADRAMGFCYLSTAAIVVKEALARGLERVAVFDFDVHHGNGTEAVLLGTPGCAFHSVHQFPCYPGTGEVSHQNARNHPVLPGAHRGAYQDALKRALEETARYQPQLLVVSAGFDAFRGDPLSMAPLEGEDFEWLGRELHAFGIPTCSVLEGGYSDELPGLILEYLVGLEGPAAGV